MAQYFTDFSGYATGAQPSDWTTRWASVSTDWRVETNAAATGGKSLNFKSGTDDNNASLLSWDAAGTPADVEIVMRYRYTGSVFDGLPAAIVGRASGTGAAKYGYFTIHYDFFGQLVGLAEYANANSYVSSQIHGSSSYASSANTWYWLRLRINGTSIQGRAWADSSSEPATWTWSATDSTTSAGGWVGVWTDGGSSLQIDLIGVGTAGDAAPKSAPAASYSLSATATQGFTGSVALGVKRPITATASQSFTGSVALSAKRPISATGTQTFTGTVALGVKRPISATATQAQTGTVALGASRPLAATGTQGQTGTVDITVLSGPWPLAASGTQAQTGTVNLGVTRPISAAGTQSQTGTTSLGVQRPISASATQDATGSVALGLSKSITASSTQTVTGSVVVTASKPLSATGTQGFTGSVDLTATRPISASGAQDFTGSADIDVYSTWSISASGTQGFTGSVAISANRPLASSGTQGFYGTVDIKGPPTDATGLLYVRATADTLRMTLATDALYTVAHDAALRLSAYDPLLRN